MLLQFSSMEKILYKDKDLRMMCIGKINKTICVLQTNRDIFSNFLKRKKESPENTDDAV